MMDSTKKWIERPSKNHSKFWLVLCCFILSFFFLVFQGGKLAFMLFIIVSLLCIYLLMGRWSGIANSRGTRTLANADQEFTLSAGTSLSVRILVNIPGFWPIPYVYVKDRLIRKNGDEQLFETSFIPDWKRTGEVIYRTPSLRRGIYRFTSTECVTEDVFGLFEHVGVLQLNETFKVLPQTVIIREWKQLNRLFRGLYQHSATTRVYRETTQINGVREYNYGDRLSRIHWNATAKTGAMKSKEFERESLPKTVLFLDCNRQHYRNNSHFELAVSIAASLCDFSMKKDLAIGMLSSGKVVSYIEPNRSHNHQHRIHNHLIEVEADGQHKMEDVLQDKLRFFDQGTLVTVISPLANQTMQQALQYLTQRQLSVCHMWVASEATASEQEQWMRRLRLNGVLSYAVRSLPELPSVLGGNM